MGEIPHQQTLMYRDMPYGYRVRAFSVRFQLELGLTALRFYRTPVCWWGKYSSQFVLQANKRALALLIAYSTKVQRWFYFPLLSQLAVIIFAIWLCRGRNQLSLSDVEFAIIQTRSPVSIYVLLLVIPRLFFQRSSFKKDDMSNFNNGQSFFRGAFSSGRLDWAIIWRQALGLLYVLCCLSVNLVHQFDKTGYIHVTQTARVPDPIPPPSLIQLESMPDGKVWLALAVCSIIVYEYVLHRHGVERREIMHQLAGKYLVACNSFCALRLIREYEYRETKEVFESMAIEQASQVHLLLIHQLAPEIHRLLCRWGFSATWYVLIDAMIINL